MQACGVSRPCAAKIAAVAVLGLALSRLAGAASPRPAADEVRSLPGLRVGGLPHSGQAGLCFRHYSGYLPTTSSEKHLFYWYVEAVENAAEKPLLLWLNGGPGCSSLGGMWTENGPFIAGADGSVTLNPFSWNKVANVLYVEQPAGVGFSYPARDTNDTITTADTHAALTAFLNDYNLYGRPLFIAGESYGGHFVPNTVEAILQSNWAGGPPINLIGFAVGNGYTDWQLDFGANVHYARYHALCSPADFEAVKRACDGDSARCFWRRPDISCPEACGSAVDNATRHALGGSIDMYDIYADVCPLPAQARVRTQEFVLERYRRRGMSPVSPIYPTCADTFTETYLSRRDVQEAIHAKPIHQWSQCDLVNGGKAQYDFNYESALPKYRDWVSKSSLRMLVYSGDADFIVNFLGTQRWIESLQLPVRKHFRTWRGSDGQVAGYVTDFAYDESAGLTFATVKGAGHMVPTDRPRHALDMISAFMADISLDSINHTGSSEPLCPADRPMTTIYM